MRMRSLLAISLVVAPRGTIAAQEPAALKFGDRVRVFAPSVSGRSLVGTLVALETDSLVVQGSANAWRLSRASVDNIYISRGRKANPVGGAVMGLLAGAGVGALIGSGFGDCMDAGKSVCMGIGAGVFGGVGVLVGAISGALTKTEQWEEVPLDRLRPGFMPH